VGNRHLVITIWGPSGRTDIAGIKESRIRNPHRKVYVLERTRPSTPITSVSYANYGYSSYKFTGHSGGSNFLFVDGHVEWIRGDHPICSDSATIAAPYWLPDR